jgi:hypothetical protein
MATAARERNILPARNRVLALANQYKVSVQFRPLHNANGETEFVEGLEPAIFLDSNLYDERKLLSAFYHELGHVHCYRNKIWQDFHDPVIFSKCATYCDWKKGLEVEQWVDSWAAAEAARTSPGLIVYQPYHTLGERTLKGAIELPEICTRKK